MKEITLKVPDQKVRFFLELAEELGVEVSEPQEEYHIPEEHKEIVRERIKLSNENPERLISWKDARKKLQSKIKDVQSQP